MLRCSSRCAQVRMQMQRTGKAKQGKVRPEEE